MWEPTDRPTDRQMQSVRSGSSSSRSALAPIHVHHHSTSSPLPLPLHSAPRDGHWPSVPPYRPSRAGPWTPAHSVQAATTVVVIVTVQRPRRRTDGLRSLPRTFLRGSLCPARACVSGSRPQAPWQLTETLLRTPASGNITWRRCPDPSLSLSLSTPPLSPASARTLQAVPDRPGGASTAAARRSCTSRRVPGQLGPRHLGTYSTVLLYDRYYYYYYYCTHRTRTALAPQENSKLSATSERAMQSHRHCSVHSGT